MRHSCGAVRHLSAKRAAFEKCDTVISKHATMPKANPAKARIQAATAHLAGVDGKMAELIEQYGPCRLGSRRDRFDALVGSILSQQLSIAAARTIKARVEIACGGKIACEPLRNLSDSQLRQCGVSPQKLGYLRSACEHVASRSLRLASLHRYSDTEVIDKLTQIKGVGVWTAEMFLIFVLHRLDVWPIGDLGVKNAVVAQYGQEHAKTANAMIQLGCTWSPYRSVAAWYLWRSLDNSPQ